jgi:hypothetical protein
MITCLANVASSVSLQLRAERLHAKEHQPEFYNDILIGSRIPVLEDIAKLGTIKTQMSVNAMQVKVVV